MDEGRRGTGVDRGPAAAGVLPVTAGPVRERQARQPAAGPPAVEAKPRAHKPVGRWSRWLARWIRPKMRALDPEKDQGREETAEPCCVRYPRCLCECYRPEAVSRFRRGWFS